MNDEIYKPNLQWAMKYVNPYKVIKQTCKSNIQWTKKLIYIESQWQKKAENHLSKSNIQWQGRIVNLKIRKLSGKELET